MKLHPSIFNDVIGPVMRGPSSSHSAAALRIGRMCRDLMGGDPGQVRVQYDSRDALATTHQSQGSDMGMRGGLLGYEPDDPRLLKLDGSSHQSGITVEFEVTDTGYNLPNLYLVYLRNKVDELRIAAVSRGGGMVELIELNSSGISISGDYHETLIYSGDLKILQVLSEDSKQWADQVILHRGNDPFLEVKSAIPPGNQWIDRMKSDPGINAIRMISPVLPVLSRKETRVPFETCKQMLGYNESHQRSMWELAVNYESARASISDDQVLQMMARLYAVMRAAIKEGLTGTTYDDRLLGPQSVLYKKSLEKGVLTGGGSIHNIVMYVSAIMEVKSSMGPIVAAPTAGACGTFPGAVLGVADSLGRGEEEIIKSLLAGSVVGLFIVSESTFSAEIGGCQAECGSASGMAAAAIVALLGGTVKQCLSAASQALQNSLGMICDPIAARVEAPCLGKNISSATNALVCANMAMAGFDHLIPLDEVIETMDRVGRSLPFELRCTALGGLSVTPSAKKLEKKLKQL